MEYVNPTDRMPVPTKGGNRIEAQERVRLRIRQRAEQVAEQVMRVTNTRRDAELEELWGNRIRWCNTNYQWVGPAPTPEEEAKAREDLEVRRAGKAALRKKKTEETDA